jgi:hypothetical protein
MTPDEIIRLAKEVGYPLVSIGGHPYIPPLLAVLLGAVAKAEREACARMVTECAWNLKGPAAAVEVEACAAAIRARGEK